MTRILMALLCVLLMASGRTRPVLPFSDNPDTNQCGLPVILNTRGTVTGTYQGRVYEQPVRLYDSHARQGVVALVPQNTPARALLLVSGPRLNHVLVQLRVNARTVEGWLPDPYFTYSW